MSRRHLAFRDKRGVLRGERGAALGFGAAALGMMAVPIVNLALLPIQVATGTLLFLEWTGESKAAPAARAPEPSPP